MITTNASISLILPTFNSIKFIDQRVYSILNQTFVNWECIVIDGFSSDGTIDRIKSITNGDSRFKYHYYPPNGPYDAINKGVDHSSGDYIYIATADDTMTPDCLEILITALVRNRSTQIAHCKLSIIDKNGVETQDQWSGWEKIKFWEKYIDQYHIRKVPLDFILHFGWNTVYSSLAQLLIKKNVFSKCGFFKTEFGPIGDFEWGLRVTAFSETIHVPQKLVSWRKHGDQLTDDNFHKKSFFFHMLIQMSLSALKDIRMHRSEKTASWLTTDLLMFYYIGLMKSLKLEFKNGDYPRIKYIKHIPYIIINCMTILKYRKITASEYIYRLFMRFRLNRDDLIVRI